MCITIINIYIYIYICICTARTISGSSDGSSKSGEMSGGRDIIRDYL